VDYRPQFKLWLATNDLPKITDSGHAIWRRIYVIRFPKTFPVVRDFELQFYPELDGILNWALEGYREYRLIGLAPPQKVLQETSEYRLKNDTVGMFIETCCHHLGSTATKDLHIAYETWCEVGGYTAISKEVWKTQRCEGV
jgi:putative DNA primase/helicase